MNKRITWTTAVQLTIFVSIMSAMAGMGLIRASIVLAPPIAGYTLLFYIGIFLLPPLITFVVYIRRHPEGKRQVIALLPIFAGVIFCCYITLIAPSFYQDVQCRVEERNGMLVRLDCQCVLAPSGSPIQQPCTAEQWLPIPLMRLVEEPSAPY